MSPETLNTIGLCANIAGVAIVFRYAFPQPSFEGGVGIEVEDATVLVGIFVSAPTARPCSNARLSAG